MKRSRIRPGLGNPIPEGQRALVEKREAGRCLRCGGPGYEVHHRRSRRVLDAHTHCICNMVLLCRTCHVWAHVGSNRLARRRGWIVSQHEGTPDRIPVLASGPWLMLPCVGLSRPLSDDQVVVRDTEPPEVSAALYRLLSTA
jgi:hypothetical protein